MLLSRIISGGQTGADRAALDIAIANNIPYGGWCPKGGWAEDFPDPPGLLAAYPHLRETSSRQPAQRTEWNVRDSDATLILLTGDIAHSPGTRYARHVAKELGRPFRVISPLDDPTDTRVWIEKTLHGGALNVAGPRGSTEPELYSQAKAFLEKLLKA